VAGSCEYNDEPAGSGATESVSFVVSWIQTVFVSSHCLFYKNFSY
jgi:hypothetical protein